MSHLPLREEQKSEIFAALKVAEFRPLQEEALSAQLQAQSVLLMLPTGGGKSLVFQSLSLLQGGLVVVVSPLIALMEDQVAKGRKLGLRITCLHSGLHRADREARLEEVRRGTVNLLLATPERFRKPEFLEVIQSRGVAHLVVDEAHCISQWGSDFRPDYSRLGEVRQALGHPPCLALTATATPEVQEEILKVLGMQDALVLSRGILRPELALNVHDVYGDDEKIRTILGLAHAAQGPVIVYVSLISTLQRLKRQIERMRSEVFSYHGQLPAKIRRQVQEEFLISKSALLLATPAFGLGVDKPDIRAVIHGEIPGTLESYFQEVGRAGRDGLRAEGHLLWDSDDVSIQEDFIKWSNPEESVIAKVFDLIEKNDADLESRGMDYLRDQINFYNSRDYRVETAVQLLERWGCLEVRNDTRFGYIAVQEPGASEFQSMRTTTRLRVQQSKLLAMVQYAGNRTDCRRVVVHKYFGEETAACGICDNCLARGRDA